MLLTLHIIAGTCALFSAGAAVFTGKGKKWHINAGRVYVVAMAVVCGSAILMSARTGNLFLLLVGLFSFYFAFSGWRFARNRSGQASWPDWLGIGTLLVAGISMWLLAGYLLMQGNSQYITMAVFGFIAIILGLGDARLHRQGKAVGKERIARHLASMLGGTIAVITAVFVVNVTLSPPWLGWVLPTIILTPVIIWWSHKVRN